MHGNTRNTVHEPAPAAAQQPRFIKFTPAEPHKVDEDEKKPGEAEEKVDRRERCNKTYSLKDR